MGTRRGAEMQQTSGLNTEGWNTSAPLVHNTNALSIAEGGMERNWRASVSDLAGLYTEAELAEIAWEEAYLYETGKLPEGARFIEFAELHGDTWLIVFKPRETLQ